MTGFGRAEIDSTIGRLGIEVSCVNSRFLELSVRLPRPLSALEPQVREYVSSLIQRGKLTIFVNLSESDDNYSGALINTAALKAYHAQLTRVKKELKIGGEILIGDLLQLPEVARSERPEPDLKVAWPVVQKAIDKSLKGMLSMRAKEGKAMAADMKKRLARMLKTVGEIRKATKDSVKLYRDKLAARIAELTTSNNFDTSRLETEVAYFAERTDITEECIRLESHIVQFQDTLASSDAVGRRLNFILQEMNREVNTIGSKGSDFSITTLVISLKEEIEKIREQAQNVE